MHIVAAVAIYVLWAFIGLLFVRFIIDWVMLLARSWRPTGAAAAVLELAYSATDPPLKFLRRLIPPLRLGSFALDVAFLLLFIVCYVLIAVLQNYV
ncbi:MAG TPA: YggT family protein [Mycobacteriales bacterium]|nr:YggT family protein [Mycobacteriales bacterium]